MHARSNFQVRIPERSIAQTETKLEAGRYIILPVRWNKKTLFSQQATVVEERQTYGIKVAIIDIHAVEYRS